MSCLFLFPSLIFSLAHSSFPVGVVSLGTHALLGLEVSLADPAPELWPPYKASFVTGPLVYGETYQSMKFLSSVLGVSDKVLIISPGILTSL